MEKVVCFAAASLLAAGTLAPAFSHAQTTGSGPGSSGVVLYGLVDVYGGSMRKSGDPARVAVLNSGGLNTSFWAIRGHEDLGGGLQAQFVLESFFQADTGVAGRTTADPLFSKNAWVGLSSSKAGSLRLGRQTNPLFLATGNSNPFGTSLSLSPLMLHTWLPAYNRTVVGDSVWDNAVQYISPTFGGLRADVAYAFGESTQTNGIHNTNLTVTYASGPLYAVVSAQDTKTGPGFTAAITEQKTYMAGMRYDFRLLRVYASAQRSRTPGIHTVTETGQLGVSVPVFAGRVLASAVHTRRDVATGTDTRRTTAAIGYEYALSRRTDLYAISLYDKLTGAQHGMSYVAGMRHRF
ncbi:putative outer membrane protein [Cupriavidus gilardii J11]|uniref:Putative outer membrane protein n=1 Tax=Cupriavidus gilardii J11 TaxID=936133 RepID=A0A562B1A6_9BURK|nr:porin [Cupriavidus gilardii]TWG78997.1 putative outer membrane protein [Cupriavidus gilardii J11]